MADSKSYFFELPSTNRPEPHRLAERWYPGVKDLWERSTEPRLFDPLFGVRAIIIHATAGGSSSGAMSVMKGGKASWHWLVPDEHENAHGSHTWACAPEVRTAWHVHKSIGHPALWEGRNNINHWSLGVEIVNTQKDCDSFSDWQLEMTASIVRYAWAKYPNLQYVVSHAMLDPHRRTDPGAGFDWDKFQNLTISETPAFTFSDLFYTENIAELDDVTPVNDLTPDPRESLCGDAPEIEFSLASSDIQDIVSETKIQASSDVNWRLALTLAECSQKSYDDPRTVQQWVRARFGDQTHVHKFDAGATEGFIAETPDKTIICFRGSKGFKDWLANMKVSHKKTRYGRVHRGFLSGFNGVASDVFAALIRARVEGREIYLTGHSLGGALAMISAAEAHYKIGETPIAGIYTFGMPKSTDQSAARYINRLFGTKFYRFVNDNDIVTRIPPGAYHAGQRVKFDGDGNIENNGKPDLSDVMSETPSGRGLHSNDLNIEDFLELQADLIDASIDENEGMITGLIPGADEHSMAEYIRLIRQQTQ